MFLGNCAPYLGIPTSLSLQLGSFFYWNTRRIRKKINQHLYVNQVVPERCNLSFWPPRTFETSIGF